MAASTAVWARGTPIIGVTPTSSQLAFLRDWDPDWQTTRLSLHPFRLLTEEALASRIEVATSTRGPQSASGAALFTSSVLPAADYDVVIAGANALDGQLVVRVGRLDQPAEQWSLQGVPSGITGLTLHLPVAVHSVVIRGDTAAQASATKLSLRLRRLLTTVDE